VCSPDKAGEEMGEVTDKKGWDAYRNDWRNFFECMLAPVAQQVEGGESSPLFCTCAGACISKATTPPLELIKGSNDRNRG
jgi:hypothetical protein